MRKVGDLMMEKHYLIYLDDKSPNATLPYKLYIKYWSDCRNHRKLISSFADYRSVLSYIYLNNYVGTEVKSV